MRTDERADRVGGAVEREHLRPEPRSGSSRRAASCASGSTIALPIWIPRRMNAEHPDADREAGAEREERERRARRRREPHAVAAVGDVGDRDLRARARRERRGRTATMTPGDADAEVVADVGRQHEERRAVELVDRVEAEQDQQRAAGPAAGEVVEPLDRVAIPVTRPRSTRARPTSGAGAIGITRHRPRSDRRPAASLVARSVRGSAMSRHGPRSTARVGRRRRPAGSARRCRAAGATRRSSRSRSGRHAPPRPPGRRSSTSSTPTAEASRRQSALEEPLAALEEERAEHRAGHRAEPADDRGGEDDEVLGSGGTSADREAWTEVDEQARRRTRRGSPRARTRSAWRRTTETPNALRRRARSRAARPARGRCGCGGCRRATREHEHAEAEVVDAFLAVAARSPGAEQRLRFERCVRDPREVLPGSAGSWTVASANASVVTARYRPRRRSAGSPTTRRRRAPARPISGMASARSRCQSVADLAPSAAPMATKPSGRARPGRPSR